MYTSDERLKLKSAGSINIYFRLAPDLFLAARQSVPLLLKFGYAGVAHDTRAALHVRLNGQAVDSIRLAPAPTSVERAQTAQLPTVRLPPSIHTLTPHLSFRAHPS